MKSIDGRVSKLEHRFGIAGLVPRYLVILTDRDTGPAEDSYPTILDEAGFLPSAGFCGLISP